MFYVLLQIVRRNQNVVEVDENEIQFPCNQIHESLESLCCVTKSEWHFEEFVETEGSSNRCLWNILWSHRDLMERFLEIDRAEDFAPFEVEGKILQVWYRVSVRHGDRVQASEIAHEAVFPV